MLAPNHVSNQIQALLRQSLVQVDMTLVRSSSLQSAIYSVRIEVVDFLSQCCLSQFQW